MGGVRLRGPGRHVRPPSHRCAGGPGRLRHAGALVEGVDGAADHAGHRPAVRSGGGRVHRRLAVPLVSLARVHPGLCRRVVPGAAAVLSGHVSGLADPAGRSRRRRCNVADRRLLELGCAPVAGSVADGRAGGSGRRGRLLRAAAVAVAERMARSPVVRPHRARRIGGCRRGAHRAGALGMGPAGAAAKPAAHRMAAGHRRGRRHRRRDLFLSCAVPLRRRPGRRRVAGARGRPRRDIPLLAHRAARLPGDPLLARSARRQGHRPADRAARSHRENRRDGECARVRAEPHHGGHGDEAGRVPQVHPGAGAMGDRQGSPILVPPGLRPQHGHDPLRAMVPAAGQRDDGVLLQLRRQLAELSGGFHHQGA